MKSFLDTHYAHSRSFLLYGNLNDDFFCGDLAIRNSDQYLVKLLKSRGYEHIIFYGDAGTKGAYCLDPESARFFFSENEGLPPATNRRPSAPVQADAEARPGEETAQARPQEATIADMIHRRPRPRRSEGGYRPGDVPGRAPETPTGTAETAPAPESEQEQPRTVRYANRAMEPGTFLELISPLMIRPGSNMAVVIYNIFTAEIGRMQTMRDCILTLWEQTRSSEGVDNICLLMAPDTVYSAETALLQQLNVMGIHSKFTRTTGQGAQSLNPDNCFFFGLPQEDEIRNMLRRLSIVGTERNHRKILFDYAQLEDIIAEISYCSRSCDSRKDVMGLRNTQEFARQIYARLQRYVDQQKGRKPVQITPDVVDDIWDRPRRDRTSAMDRLNRPGWEKAYQLVKRVVEECEQYRKREMLHFTPEPDPPDWTVRRISTEPPKVEIRPLVPNFVLLGPPGVGKTTIARLIGEILREHGILKIGSTVEVTRANLVSSYVGGVPQSTMGCVERAEEGVLFIDEAHSIGRKDGGANHDGTGKEIVSTLNSAMNPGQRHFSVILAGYKADMQAVFDLDNGFQGRFRGNFVVIDDYEPELLQKILLDNIRANHCEVSPALTSPRNQDGDVSVPITNFVTRIYQQRDRQKFRNAAVMETLALSACAAAKGGTVTEECFYACQPDPDLADQDLVDHSWFVPQNVGDSLEKILQELRSEFVGMDNIVHYFRNKALEIEEILSKGGTEEDVPLRPIILLGDPGVGKSVVASKLGRLLFRYHLLGTPEIIKTRANSLASPLSGGTMEKVEALIQQAQDRKAMLLVEEAHNLDNPSMDGRGAMQAFMDPMTDRAHPFMAVFAVYPSRLKSFLALDPGAQSRFEIISMESYNGEQLFEILKKMMEKFAYVKLSLAPKTDQLLRRVCSYIYATRDEQTGNARCMENLLKDMNNLRRERCAREGIGMTDEAYGILQPEDVPRKYVDALPPEDPSVESIMQELDSLIGLAPIKKQVRDLVSLARANLIRRQLGLPALEVVNHMLFIGKPGTGKTTVARLLGKIYQAIGVLDKGHVVEVSREDLVGSYIGHSEEKTKAKIQEAMGGILFIDEAYSLNNHSENDFGAQVVDTILKKMEDYRDKFIVIAAGYPGKMKEFTKMNPGLESRFPTSIDFPDYSAEELMEILRKMCSDGKLILTPEAETLIAGILRSKVNEHDPNFANGRYVRNLFDKMIRNQSSRVAEQGTTDPTQLQTFRPEDVPEEV